MEPATRSPKQVFDPQSQLLANGDLACAVGYREFILWDTNTGKIQHRIPAKLGEVAARWAWAGNRLAYQIPGGGAVSVISLDGADVASVLAEGPSATSLALSMDGNHLAAALFPGGVSVFGLATGEEKNLNLAGKATAPRVTVAYTPNGELLVASGTDQVPAQLWDGAGTSLRWSRGSAREYYHLRQAGDRFFSLTATEAGFAVEVRDAAFQGITEYPISVFPAGLAVNNSGSHAAVRSSSGTEANVAQVIALTTGELRRFVAPATPITDLAFTTDGSRLLVLTSTHGVQAFDVETGQVAVDFELPS